MLRGAGTARLALALLLMGIGLGIGPAAAAVGVSAPDPADDAIAGLLVRFTASASDSVILRTIAAAGGHLEESSRSTGFAVVSTGSTAPAAVAAALVTSPFVDKIEPNRIRHAATVPNDPRYSAQQAYLEARAGEGASRRLERASGR